MAKEKETKKPVGAAEEAAPATKYSKKDQRKIAELTDAGTELTGNETPEQLDTLIAAMEIEGRGEHPEAEVVPGVPNNLPIRTEPIVLANKHYNFAVFFMAAVKGGQALYNYEGKRVSPAYGPEDILPGSEGSNPVKALQYTVKACARFNAIRRKSVLPGDAELGAGTPVK